MYVSKPGPPCAAAPRAESEVTRAMPATTPPIDGAHADSVPLRRSERIRNRREGVRTAPIAAQIRTEPRLTRYPASYLSVLRAISLRSPMASPALQARPISMADTCAADRLAADVRLTEAPATVAPDVGALADTATEVGPVSATDVGAATAMDAGAVAQISVTAFRPFGPPTAVEAFVQTLDRAQSLIEILSRRVAISTSATHDSFSALASDLAWLYNCIRHLTDRGVARPLRSARVVVACESSAAWRDGLHGYVGDALVVVKRASHWRCSLVSIRHRRCRPPFLVGLAEKPQAELRGVGSSEGPDRPWHCRFVPIAWSCDDDREGLLPELLVSRPDHVVRTTMLAMSIASREGALADLHERNGTRDAVLPESIRAVVAAYWVSDRLRMFWALQQRGRSELNWLGEADVACLAEFMHHVRTLYEQAARSELAMALLGQAVSRFS